MGEKRNYAALEWVIGEIGDALNEARQALEAYAQDSRDQTRIRFCLAHIHQVLGSLKMVEFHGAVLFAEEMELLTEAIIAGQVVNHNEAQEVLMRSLLQLPIYLDHVKRVQDDHPGIVLPLLNDLRAARKEPLLSETNLFTPQLDSISEIRGEHHPLLSSGPKLNEVLKKLSEMYQYSAASLLRGIKVEESLGYVSKVFSRLETVSAGTAQGILWYLASGVADSLVEDEIELSVAVKGILRRLAREQKVLAEGAPEAFETPPAEGLVRNLLYYIARSGNVSDRIAEAKRRFALDKALYEGAVEGRSFHKNMISAPDAETIRTVIAALHDEMNTIKQIISHVVTSDGDLQDLQAALPVVKRVADTLAVMGIDELRDGVNTQHERLKALCDSQQNDDDLVADIANELVTIEHRLEAISKGAGKISANQVNERDIEIDEAKLAVLSECRAGLEKLKDSIIAYCAAEGDKSALEKTAEIVQDIRGGLQIIPLKRAALLVVTCGEYVRQHMMAPEADAPSNEDLAALASAIEGIDYYLDRLATEDSEDVTRYLDLSASSLEELGMNVPEVVDSQAKAVELPESQVDQNEDSAPILDAAFVDETEQNDSAEYDSAEYGSAEYDSAEYDSAEYGIVEYGSADQDAAELASPTRFAEATEPQKFELADGVDEDIAEIFTEEAREVIQTLQEHLPQWSGHSADGDDVMILRRAFHTLKGSGRMVKADDVSELAWAVESLFNRIIDKSVTCSSIHPKFVGLVTELLSELIDAFDQRLISPKQAIAKVYESWGYQLAEGKIPPALENGEIPTIDNAAETAPLALSVADSLPPAMSAADQAEQETLWRLFASEAQTHLAAIDEFVEKMEAAAPIYGEPNDKVQRALHTLKGSAHMAGVGDIAILAAPLEIFLKELRSYQLEVDDDTVQLIKDAAAYTREGLEFLERNEPAIVSKRDQFVARVAELKERMLGHLLHASSGSHAKAAHPVDPRMLAIFMAEDIELLLDADEVLERWRADLSHTQELPAMMAELKTLESGADQANFPHLSSLSGQLHDLYAAALDHLTPDALLFDTFHTAHNCLLDMVDAVAAAQTLPPIPQDLQSKLREYLALPLIDEVIVDDFSDEFVDDEHHDESGIHLAASGIHLAAIEMSPEVEPEGLLPEVSEADELFEPEADGFRENESSRKDRYEFDDKHDAAVLESNTLAGFTYSGGDPSVIDSEDFDFEIIEIFLEEADELVEQLEEAIHDWESDWQSTDAPDEMKRALHTLKGGARLSNLGNLGDLTHEYETFLINTSRPEDADNFFEVVHKYQDLVLEGVKGVKASLGGGLPPEKPAEPERKSAAQPVKPEILTAKPTPAATAPVITSPKIDDFDDGFQMPPSPAQEASALIAGSKKSASQEVVKISAELLEELVNLAGETSISRGRLEQQVSDFGTAIGEIDTTLRRLQEQLRRLDMETEAQIVFRQEQLADNEEFDPLEMDRYSQLQQLSRSLTESASDLVDLKRTLSDKVKDTEAILLQQQRINSSLQEGLMRARMVPFSRMVPRLRRIVRQVATELNKQVSFELDNIEGEMDRSVLEHMVAPLEHMLRNAADHGIESPSERLAANKSESGRILLSFAREGGDILLRLADDGRGIALEKVRKKAIERGLMSEDADLSEHDIMQFILQAGFSTADNVTQISGRGVGMDVVAAEIKQLGGSITIESKEGVGTQFTVRLPFTVSVNRALMVNIGHENFAIPLNTIEGIVRVSPFELEHYYSQEDAKFEYAGESYDVRYLGGMLYDEMQPKLEGHAMPLPVVLVRSAQNTMALQVDGLQGSREIVVKSLGSQFASVQGLSGATVMGDGSVVVILDPHALVRRAVATIGLLGHSGQSSYEREEVVKTIMVVDDSVTVRKVTTRFLEREGFNVITAKDGVDALQILQERVPDLMLLDIEMPRMDGFEVAKNMRTASEWEAIPIIMITSRTGDKHREHALSIGVNHYMGKPYQEEQLLESIQELLGR